MTYCAKNSLAFIANKFFAERVTYIFRYVLKRCTFLGTSIRSVLLLFHAQVRLPVLCTNKKLGFVMIELMI